MTNEPRNTTLLFPILATKPLVNTWELFAFRDILSKNLCTLFEQEKICLLGVNLNTFFFLLFSQNLFPIPLKKKKKPFSENAKN